MRKRSMGSVPRGVLHIGLTTLRRRRTLLTRLLLVLVLFPVALQLFLAHLVGNRATLAPLGLQHARNLLIVTSHPDDECLFFAPSVLGILEAYPNILGRLLSLSTGNHHGMGEVRKKELQGSCEALGISKKSCVAVNHQDLQDDPRAWWNETAIQDVVQQHVKAGNVDTILTFDDGGVSGQLNHRAVSAAIQNYIRDDPTAPQAFCLTTTSLLRKYTFLWDLPLTTMLFASRNTISKTSDAVRTRRYRPEGLAVSTMAQYRSTRAAFASHESQYSWDRHLYMFWSRYVWFNSLRKVQ